VAALKVESEPMPGESAYAGGAFPLRLACRTPGAVLADVRAWIRTDREALEERLRHHGAILFHGFPVRSAQDFDAVVGAFEYPNFAYEESLSNAVRVNVSERVFTANEAPPSATIRLHHEMAQTPIYPSRLFFFCEKPAEEGGATPVCRSDALLEALGREIPEFVRACADKGLIYTNVMPPSDDPTSGLGRSWRSTFGVPDRAGAEERMRRLGYTWEWLPDDCLRATTPVLPAVRTLASGRQSFFNQLIAALAWQDRRNEAAKAISLGDGTPIDLDAAARAGELAEGLAVDLAWEAGDVALVDNFAVMHGRRSFEGTRRVLASLVAADA
jgi:alpha-ketoglutarate-dependent taurine dioxygenase